MGIKLPIILAIMGMVLMACILSGCTSTTSPSPSAAASTTVSTGVPSSAPSTSTGTFVPGVTKTDTGYIVKGNENANDQKVTLKAGTYTFHILLSDFSQALSGQAYVQGTGSVADQQITLVMFTDPIWGPDMTITKAIPADGDYEIHVSYLNNWEVDISQ